MLIVAAVIILQMLSGAIVLAAIVGRRRLGLPTLAVVGSLFGFLLFLLGAQVSIAFFGTTVGWLTGPIIALVLIIFEFSRRRQIPGTWSIKDSWLALAWAPASLAAGILQIPNWERTPLADGYIVGDRYHPDLVFFEAVGQSVSLLGPSDSLLLSDAPIKYHWFIYGWSGLMTRISGVEAFWVTTRLVPLLLIVLGAVLAALWARMLSSGGWVPALAAWLVVVAGYVGADQGVILTFDSPSNGFASVVLLAFAMTVTLALRTDRPLPMVLLAGFWAFALVGAKASHAAVAGIGIAVMAAALTLRRDRSHLGTAWSLTAATAVGSVIAYLLLLAGISGSDSQIAFGGGNLFASTYQGLDPGPGVFGVVLGTIALLLAIAPRWVGLVEQIVTRQGRQQPETWLGWGMVLAGALPLFVLTSGTNAAWFALGASAPVAVLSAVGIGNLGQRVVVPRPRRTWIIIGILGVAAIAWLLTVVNYGLVQVTGAAVAWRSPTGALLVVITGAAALAALMQGRWSARWAFLIAVTVSVTAVLARVSGPVLWNYTAALMQPTLSRFVLLLDPAAELNGSADPAEFAAMRFLNRGSLRSAAGRIPVEDLQQQLVSQSIAFAAERIQWSPARQEAAGLLRARAEPSDVVAMDASISQPFLPIATNLRVLLAGQPYTDGYTSSTAARTIPARFAMVDEFRLTGSPSAHRQLWEAGVRYLWFEFSPQGDSDRLASLTEPIYVGPEVAVLRLNDPDANSG